MAQQDHADATDAEAESLSETQIALMLRHAPETALSRQVESARGIVAREWQESEDERAEKFARIRDTRHYEADVLGWQILDDYGSDPAVRMVVVTPVPDWEDLQELDEITREFIHDMKAQTIVHINAMQNETGLSPAEFTALLVEVFGDGDLRSYADALDRSPDQLAADIDTAEAAVSQARALADVAPVGIADAL